MRYGKQTVMMQVGSAVLSEEHTYYEGAIAKSVTKYNESMRVKGQEQALTEFLKLLDAHKAGELLGFGVTCHTDKDGKINRIEKMWIVPNLQTNASVI